METKTFQLVAKTLAEMEDVLAEELTNLGADDVEIGTRMVSFKGDQAMMYKANIHCRTALRILKPIYTFKAENADEVYAEVKKFDWESVLSLDKTFAIDAVVSSHIFTHSQFVAYRVKDGIVDFFQEKYEKRPSVRVSNPDVMINVHVNHKTCTISLDSSGESLHKRGYRVAQTDAPLSEVLAAGMILKSGWHGECDFIDPMCGSGTILIEAAMIALGIPPGIHRESFAFEKWPDFDADLFSELYNDDSTAKEFHHRIIGSDISPKAIAVAEKNIRNAGLKKYIDLSVKPLQAYTEKPAPSGVIMTNPPYGERLKVDDLEELYDMIGERFKHVFTDYKAYVLSYRKECFDKIGLRHSNRFFLYNGPLECEMREYEVFSGKRRDQDRLIAPGKRTMKEMARNERNSKEGYRRSRRRETEAEDKQERQITPRDGERRPFRRSDSPRDGERRPYRRNDSPRDGERKSFERKPFSKGARKFDDRKRGDDRKFRKDRPPRDRK